MILEYNQNKFNLNRERARERVPAKYWVSKFCFAQLEEKGEMVMERDVGGDCNGWTKLNIIIIFYFIFGISRVPFWS